MSVDYVKEHECEATQTFATYSNLQSMSGARADSAGQLAAQKSTASATPGASAARVIESTARAPAISGSSGDSSVRSTRHSRPATEVRAVIRTFMPLLGRMVATTAAASLVVFLLLEISIPGGFSAVISPNGDSRSARTCQLADDFQLDLQQIQASRL